MPPRPPFPERGATGRSDVVGRATGGLVLGEDVVELVAPATRGQAAHVRALAVAVLELRLGLVGLVTLVGIVVLGEAEVDERAVPGVPEGHVRRNYSFAAVLLQVVRRGRAGQR